jgi:hypothetical protein
VQAQSMPFVAEALELDCAGRVKRQVGWSLPALVNGSYSEAALDGEELLLVAHYTTAMGNGHLLSRLPLKRLSDPELANVVLNVGAQTELPVVDELAPDQADEGPERPRLVAGERYTPWAGLAIAAERVLLGAGSRGVVVLPRAFEADSRAELVDVGGSCVDLANRGDLVRALVTSEGTSRVVTLRFDPARNGFRKQSELAVAGAWEQLVR